MQLVENLSRFRRRFDMAELLQGVRHVRDGGAIRRRSDHEVHHPPHRLYERENRDSETEASPLPRMFNERDY